MIRSMPMHEGRMLPSFFVRQIDLPDIVNWDVNSQHYLVIKVEMISKNNRPDLEDREDKKRVEAQLQILSIKALGDEPVDAKALEKKDFERVVAKAKSGAFLKDAR